MSPWQDWARRVDALSLRERVILFLAAAVLMLAVADQAVLSPSLQAARQAQRPLQTEAAELTVLRTQLQSLTQAATASDSASSPKRLQEEIKRLEVEHIALQARLHPGRANDGPSSARLPDLLARVLQRQPQLTLQGLDTHPTPSAAPASSASNDLSGWQAADLRVSGSYAELQRFITELETRLPGLRWGSLHLDAQPGPPLLQVTVWMPGDTP